jgi:acyl carrier protein
MDEIRNKIEKVFEETFKVEPPLDDTLSSGDINAWDSLNHIVLINNVEESFNISFELDEMLTMQSFGEICDAVRKKVGH